MPETSKTLFDIILRNTLLAIKLYEIIPTSISDHNMIECISKINHKKFESITIQCRDAHKFNQESMIQNIFSTN